MYRPNKKQMLMPWLAGVAVLLALVLAFKLLDTVLTPFIVAAVLAYILNPLVEKLQKHGVPRMAASMLVMLFALLVLAALLLIIVPMLVKQFYSIAERLPALAGYVQHRWLPWFNEMFGGYVSIDGREVAAWLRENAQEIQAKAQAALQVLLKQGSALAIGLGNLLLLPLLLYYFLMDWQRWADGLAAAMPRRYLTGYTRVAGNVDTVLGEFLRGQLTVMLVMGVLYGVGLMVVGLDSGFAIGVVAGLLVFIPYLGAFTGLLLATLAALLQFGAANGLLMVWAVFAVGQLLESFVVTPKIVGDRIGLSPFWVIFALMAFGQLLGFVGMLVALPLAAVCLVFLREAKCAYVRSHFYRRTR